MDKVIRATSIVGFIVSKIETVESSVRRTGRVLNATTTSLDAHDIVAVTVPVLTLLSDDGAEFPIPRCRQTSLAIARRSHWHEEVENQGNRRG